MGRARIHIYAGRRAHFKATFVRYGTRPDSDLPTVLLVELYDAYGELVGDHAWIQEPAAFISAGVQEGDTVAFNAYVRQYNNGYLEHDRHLAIEQDWKLESPSDVRIVNQIGEEFYGRHQRKSKENQRRNKRSRNFYSLLSE